MESSTTPPTTSQGDPLNRPPVQIGIEVFFAVLIILVSFLGNALLIYVIHREPRLKTITNVFIESLAWTDVSMAALHMPFWALAIRYGQWAVAEAYCPWAGAILSTFCFASILTMGLVAVNRYFKVVKPQLYNKLFPSRKSACIYSVVIWLVAIFIGTTPLYGWGVMSYNPAFAVCTMQWELEQISYLVLVVAGVINGTTVLIFWCYYKIYKTVKASSANVAAHSNNNGAHTTTVTSADIKLLKSTFTAVCFFVVTWTPVTFVVIWETAEGHPVPRVLSASTLYLVSTSSLGNPIIYGILSPQFRRAFLRTFRRSTPENTSRGLSNNAVAPTHG